MADSNNNNNDNDQADKDLLISFGRLSGKQILEILNDNPNLKKELQKIKPIVEEKVRIRDEKLKKPNRYVIEEIGKAYILHSGRGSKAWTGCCKTEVGNIPFLIPVGYKCRLKYLKRTFVCSVQADGVDPSYVVRDVKTGTSSPAEKYPTTAWKSLLKEMRLKEKDQMKSLDGYFLFGFRSKEFKEKTDKLEHRDEYEKFLNERENESPRKPSPVKSRKSPANTPLSPVSEIPPSSPEKQPPGSPQNKKTGPPKKELFPSDDKRTEENEKLEARKKQHADLQKKREDWWKGKGIDFAKDTKVAHDICVKKNDGVIVEEIKSLDVKKDRKDAKADQRKQVRLALGQLVDYKQQLEHRDLEFVQMMAVFSYEIQERYKNLLERHNIATSWLTNDGIFQGTEEAERMVNAFTSDNLQHTPVLKQHLLECSHCASHDKQPDSNSQDQPDEEEFSSDSEEDSSSEEDDSSSSDSDSSSETDSSSSSSDS